MPRPSTAPGSPTEDIPRDPAYRSILAQPFIWPGTEPGAPPERITIGEAIPRWIRTTGCTWDEALARVGVLYRTAERWMQIGARHMRAIARAEDLGIPAPRIEGHDFDCLTLYRETAMACAEVVCLWQAILEREGRGGFPMISRTLVEKTAPDGTVLERVETTKTETARPDTAVIRWKMSKQIERYRERDLTVNFITSPIQLPDPSDEEVADAAVVSLRQFQEALRNRAIPATATPADPDEITLD